MRLLRLVLVCLLHSRPAVALVPVGAAAAAHAAAAAATALHAATFAAGAHTGAVGISVTAASHAVAVNAASAAAVGATGVVATAPDAITTAMQKSRRPQLQAIGRIIQIELKRLQAVALAGGNPTVVVQRVCDTAVSRAPIIKWGLDLWLRSALEREARVSERLARKRELQGKVPLPPWQRIVHYGYTNATLGKVPDILSSLRVLQLDLANQIKLGLRTSPLRVLRLVHCSILVTICALVAQYPGFEAVRVGVAKRWPRLIVHLAATLEENLAETRRLLERSRTTLTLHLPDEHGVLEEVKNCVEAVTGVDIDGDGVVGKSTTINGTLTLNLRDRDGMLENMKNVFESITGIDIDGDGHVGMPPSTSEQGRINRVRTLLRRRPFGRREPRVGRVALTAPQMQLRHVTDWSRACL